MYTVDVAGSERADKTGTTGLLLKKGVFYPTPLTRTLFTPFPVTLLSSSQPSISLIPTL
jgi:hypothetical protein